MKIILAIGTGSFIGGISRYLLSQFIQSRIVSTFPFATLSVNIIGCFLIGIVFGFSERANLNPEWRLFLATGILGGFTTFSAFSNETFGLIRAGEIFNASAYIAASVFLGILATWIGYSVLKMN
ncbi:MAG: fluoride efflux transporter CrcB [Bacteroidetes bacterium]|nr:fluoride efflux transporter CrcB [Bacteroidota bacterium]